MCTHLYAILFCYACLNPLLGNVLGILIGCSIIHLVFVYKQTHKCVRVEFLAFYVLPQIGSGLVHAYNLGEVYVLLAFGNDDVLAADVS